MLPLHVAESLAAARIHVSPKYAMKTSLHLMRGLPVDLFQVHGRHSVILLRVSALHATLNPCSRQRQTRAAAPTLVYELL
ncbi:hypothetical protein Y032_0243g3471 [Ancylostoma ceylanicum]|uniref:Uncharacterized protein n=1 Tax=Ancylostoma ceylanicum TaxID=53326 RepID=A0A016SE57_9BILA|nr:hypothetical protein Y032_0243g3471 [Ancylostoma ceylanicum]